MIRRVAVSREGEGGLESEQPQWADLEHPPRARYMLLGKRRTASERSYLRHRLTVFLSIHHTDPVSQTMARGRWRARALAGAKAYPKRWPFGYLKFG